MLGSMRAAMLRHSLTGDVTGLIEVDAPKARLADFLKTEATDDHENEVP
jgi:hypothetical protein